MNDILNQREHLARIEALESQMRIRSRMVWLVAGISMLVAVAAIGAAATVIFEARSDASAADEIRTRRLVVVDAQGQMRVRIGSDDASDPVRNSQVVGLTIYDQHGDERGGIATAEDDSAAIALDAPAGVGASMRDRIGMKVEPSGESWLALISNRPGFAAALRSKDEIGTLELTRPDLENGRFDVRIIGHGEDAWRQDAMDTSQP